ncbi:MAG TPA: DUF3105 domain-containing protein [Acidimicrobiales bacterium]|nr:DUF3105 domain-containing protein [Acidimicrobiales bacterium]
MGRLRSRFLALAALATAVTLGATTISGCGSGSAAQITVPVNGCAPASLERLDPRSTIHLFPGAPEPTYLTNPPTSGPHRLGPPYTGVVTAPIPRPSQVAMLESGYVIVQSQGLPPVQEATLDTLAGTLVTVAPPVVPLPSPIVATAWTWKLFCGSVTPSSLSALRAFISAHKGVGFFGHIPVTIPATAVPGVTS